MKPYDAQINFTTNEDNWRNHVFSIKVIVENKYSKWERMIPKRIARGWYIRAVRTFKEV